MKRLLIISMLLGVALAGYSQYEDLLPMRGTSADTDTIRLVKSGSALMLKSTMFQETVDTFTAQRAAIQLNTDAIEALEPGGGVYTFERGLARSGGTVGMGGSEGSPSLINADSYIQTSSWYFSLTNYDSPVGYNGLFLDDGGALLYAGSTNRGGGVGSGVQGWFSVKMSGGSPYYATLEMAIKDPVSGATGLYMYEETQEVVFKDVRATKKGIIYDQPDEADWTDTTLATRGYVDKNNFSEVSYTTCLDNTTTNISLDTDGVSFRLHYVAERDMGSGVRKQSGYIDLLYDDVADVNHYSSRFIGVDLDFIIESSDVAGAIRIDVVVGNANTNDLSFDYNVISKLYE